MNLVRILTYRIGPLGTFTLQIEQTGWTEGSTGSLGVGEGGVGAARRLRVLIGDPFIDFLKPRILLARSGHGVSPA
jgi:hypothetical protein